MTTLKVNIGTTGAAFEDAGAEVELARILNVLANRIENEGLKADQEFVLREMNGNKTGTASYGNTDRSSTNSLDSTALQFSIATTGAAFEDAGAEVETARILKALASRIESNGIEAGQELTLRDMNGNKVGIASYESSEHSNTDLLDRGIANVLSESEPTSPTRNHSQRLG